MKALGFIETKGLVGNIDATDAMLKAADVEFIGSDTIGAGLTTVIFTCTRSPSARPKAAACVGVMWMWRSAIITPSGTVRVPLGPRRVTPGVPFVSPLERTGALMPMLRQSVCASSI